MAWYDQNKRILPWRKNSDPYSVWVSEIMLQQTQVETVIPYYNKWMKTFPTILHLADATLDSCLKIWEGLGYYNRCKNFHRAAKTIKNHYHGEIPLDKASFQSLPGVGEYTANMVLSLVRNEPRVAVDGNIKRIGYRLLGIKHDTRYNEKRVHTFLSHKITENRPGDFNQALMDLGSSLCTPSTALCNQCPIRIHCKAAKTNPLDFAIRAKKKKTPCHHVVTGIIWKNGSFYIQKRKEKQHLGGLWEFPGGKVEKGESEVTALIREIDEECSIKVLPTTKVGTVKHAYSHFSIHLSLYHCIPENQLPRTQPDTSKWITQDEVPLHAFPKANHKLFELLDKQQWKKHD